MGILRFISVIGLREESEPAGDPELRLNLGWNLYETNEVSGVPGRWESSSTICRLVHRAGVGGRISEFLHFSGCRHLNGRGLTIQMRIVWHYNPWMCIEAGTSFEIYSFYNHLGTCINHFEIPIKLLLNFCFWNEFCVEFHLIYWAVWLQRISSLKRGEKTLWEEEIA